MYFLKSSPALSAGFLVFKPAKIRYDKEVENKHKTIIYYSIFAVAVIASGFFILQQSQLLKFEQIINFSQFPIQNILETIKPIEEEQNHVELPEYVRGIYLTAYSASRDDFRSQLIEKMSAGYINSVVIDIKDAYGRVLYNTDIEEVKQFGAVTLHMPDVEKVLDDFHQAGIYVIARQVIFQDPKLVGSNPDLALKTYNGNTWHNYAGRPWSDPQKQEVWDYNLSISKEAIELGFDEINFDYIRYPSDGPIGNLSYNLPEGKTRSDALKDFFIYASSQLSDKTKISVDLFGLVLDNVETGYDLGIGQVLVDAAESFDFICPMVYPSHYPPNYLGFDNPAAYPGQVVSYGLNISSPALEEKRGKLRPWLQAFSLGATYDYQKIKSQINVTEAATSTAGWLLWNARNYYPDFIFEE